MVLQKDFKRLVRARMQKTGESYTAARAQLLSRPAPSRPAGASTPSTPDYARLAGMSDAAIEKRTGCTWEKWVWALDHAGAADWSHRAIAQHVRDTWKVPDWWTQAVTVGYERIRGLRDVGQRRSGAWEASKSKTVPAPAATVYRAFTDTRLRRKWLPGVKPTIRKATPARSVRMSWDDGTSVEVWLVSKGEKTAVQVSHRKLAGKEDAAARKAWWGERLARLAEELRR